MNLDTLYNRFLICLIAILPLVSIKSLALWSAEVASGVVYNVPTPLTIQQSGEPEIDITAQYDTHPFDSPLYHDIRVGKWSGNTAWEFEDIHHKIYLHNTTEDVPYFSISHGYNIFTVNHAWRTAHNFIWRLGAGVVIAHPESEVRGKSFDETGGSFNNSGYYLAGATALASIGKRFYLTKAFFFELEGKVTASYATVQIADGDADAPNIALHGNFGIGYDF